MNWETDLPLLLPESYRQEQRVRELFEAIGEWIDTFPQTKATELIELVSPLTVPLEFKQLLSDLIGFQISTFDDPAEFQIRRQMQEAVEWYKLKGTYVAIEIVIFSTGLSVTVFDKYTIDYVNFIRTPWFVSGIGIDPVPPGFFKSAHFDLDFNLSFFFGASPTWYLVNEPKFTEIARRVEEFRPANTVPHFVMALSPITDQQKDILKSLSYELAFPLDASLETSLAFTIPESQISTIVTNLWVSANQTFDIGLLLDDSLLLDISPSGFLASVTNFKVGIGRRGSTPRSSFTDLETPVFSATLTSKAIFADRVEIEFVVPTGVSIPTGVTEWGLFNSVLSEMYVVGTHPFIFKDTIAEIRYSVTIFFDDQVRP